jgi:uncharacterized protein YdgA (DUF945 family)
MNSLKKYGAVAGGIAIVACWPLVVGQIGQNLIMDNITKASNSMLSTQLVSFDRGYLSSELISKVSVVDPGLKVQLESDGLATEWYLVSEIDHKLLTLDAKTRLRDYPNVPVSISSVSQLTGNTHLIAKLDKIDYAFKDSPEKWTLDILASELIADFSPDSEISVTLHMPELNLSNLDGDYIKLSQLSSSARGKKQHQLWIGDQSLSIDSFEIGSLKEENLYVVQGLSYSTISSITPATKDKNNTDNKSDTSTKSSPVILESKTKVTADQMVAADQQIDNITFEMNLGDLDADNIGLILDTLQSGRHIKNDQDQQRLVSAIDSIFDHGFYIHFDEIGFSYLNQPVWAKILLNIAPGEAHITKAPMNLPPKLFGDIHFKVPKALVEQVPNLQLSVDQLRTKGYITETKSDFEFYAKLEDGNVVFSNGEKLPMIAALMPLFMR